jgi:NAD(P)H-flavin reductase
MSPATKTTAEDLYLPRAAQVMECRQLTAMEKYFKFQDSAGAGLAYQPGQFMEVSVPLFGEAPISISSSPTRNGTGTFEMIVRRVGNVTGAMHRLNVGDTVGVRGPFGTHFPVEEAMKGQDILFVCGGIGIVPLRSAIHYVLDRRHDYGDVTILYGARRPSDLLFTSELYFWKQSEHVCLYDTVDAADMGWSGNVGVITTLFDRVKVDPARTVAVICGPPIMYKFVLLELRKLKFAPERIFVSLERHMKCGVGKCGHCQMEGVYVCQDGPVFPYARIAGMREAI